MRVLERNMFKLFVTFFFRRYSDLDDSNLTFCAYLAIVKFYTVEVCRT